MHINSNYVLIKKIEEPKKEGEFETAEVQDSFVFKGQVIQTPETPVFVDNHEVIIGDVVIFQKYSPDTLEVELDKEKKKFVKGVDLIAVI